jgi:magnesium chelatase family protein
VRAIQTKIVTVRRVIGTVDTVAAFTSPTDAPTCGVRSVRSSRVISCKESAVSTSQRWGIEEKENHRTTYPARFQLVAAMNPCRCGMALEPGYACRRGPNERCVAQYGARISGPLLDRIDLRIEVAAVTAADLILPPPAEGSAEAAARVATARALQSARYATLGLPAATTNATCPATVIESAAAPDAEGAALIRHAAETMRLSARGFHRTLRVARTLADLDGEAQVRRLHLAEALSSRARGEQPAAAA